jgi:HSP20 family protein
MATDNPEKKGPFDPLGRPVFKDGGIDDLFESHTPFGRSETGFLAGKSFHVAANIYESPTGLVITVDCPGILRENVDLKLEGSRLIVSGKREFVKEQPDEEFLRLERGFGSFFRVFEVPANVDDSSISAKLENGVLRIVVPVHPARREIKVETDG